MNFELTDEQQFLREAARGALARHRTIEAAHELLEGGDGPDLWPTAVEAGWSGLLIEEAHGGAGLGALDAMLVFAETGRVLASLPLLGHVLATAALGATGSDAGSDAGESVDAELLRALASGERRAAAALSQPPGDLQDEWTTDPESGMTRPPAPTLDGDGRISGSVAFVPDLPGADVLVVVALDGEARARVAVVEAAAEGVSIEPVRRYDATRSLGHLSLDRATARVVGAGEDEARAAWQLAQGLLAAESLGSVETALESSVAYAKERFTFGRAIGSYQAVKHALVEVLRQLENARSLMYYAGWARQDAPDEFPLAACALRVAAGAALDFAARELISVHGGIGATWEHDAPLFFRRAQLSRRLLGGAGGAADRVAGELLAAAV